MTSKTSLQRRTDALTDSGDGGDGPDEFVITDLVVGTDWEPGYDRDAGEIEHDYGAEPTPVCRTRIWRDENSEWHSERADLRDDSSSSFDDREAI